MKKIDHSTWRVSLHGGHSSKFCDHAGSTLEEIIEAAIAAGYHTFGVAEHAPRVEAHRLYAEEQAMGWTVDTLEELFAEYASTLTRLAEQYAGKITILKGFEVEVVPEESYVEVMQGYRQRYGFDYVVGSVHWVAGEIIDYTRTHFEQAMAACGDLEGLAVRYYETVADMVRRLQPEIVGHLDLIRRYAPDEASVGTPAIRRAALNALDVIAASGAILDVNTAGYRKGLGRPYPAAWLVTEAHARQIPFCFGDDSHRVSEVGAGIDEARQYLLANGVTSITVLTREEDGVGRKKIPLQ